MAKRTTLTVLLLLLAVVGSACGLLGITNSDPKPTAVTATLQALAAAGKSKDLEAMKMHIASSVVASIEGGIEIGGSGISPQSTGGVLDLLAGAWSDATMREVSLSTTTIEIVGNTAVAEGAFVIEYTDAEGYLKRCVGTGSVEFTNSGGRWLVTVVIVDEVDCTIVSGPEPDEPDPGTKPTPEPTAPRYSFDICEYLVIGAQGEQVLALQTSLKHFGYYTGLLDGDFGPMTERSVRNFQADYGLYVDGEAGPKTLTALDEALKSDGGYFFCAVANDRPTAGPTTLTYSYLRKGTPFETEVLTYESPVPGPTIVMVGCIHGNERSGHIALKEAIDSGISISRGRLVLVPAFNRLACEQNRRTLSYPGDVLSGKDFNRMFPVGERPYYYIAREMWDLIKSQPNLAIVIDFHDGFINSLGNSLIHTQQSKARSVARKLRDELNKIRPSGARGPKWRTLTEPIAGSLTRKVGRDLGVPAILIELSGRNPGDPVSLRTRYVHTIMRELGREYGMQIAF